MFRYVYAGYSRYNRLNTALPSQFHVVPMSLLAPHPVFTRPHPPSRHPAIPREAPCHPVEASRHPVKTIRRPGPDPGSICPIKK